METQNLKNNDKNKRKSFNGFQNNNKLYNNINNKKHIIKIRGSKSTIKNKRKSFSNKKKIFNINTIDQSHNKSKINLKNRENNESFENINVNKKYKNNTIKYNKKLNGDLMDFNDYELNSMNYIMALKYDKRKYIQYYISLLRTKHSLIFTFIPSNDYNSTSIKICLFLFSFALYYTINCLFITDSTIHKIYEEEGQYIFFYLIPKILYSTIISTIINAIIRFLSLTQNDILKLKSDNKIKDLNLRKKKLYKCLRIKFLWFYKLSFCFLSLFWYYLSCFCAIYKNTQIHLLKDAIISYGISLLYPFGIYLMPGIFRIASLKNGNKEYLYTISKLIQII